LKEKAAAPKAAALIQIVEEPATDPTPPATDAAAQAAAAPEKPADEPAHVTKVKEALKTEDEKS
jgi:hypothetical protein